MTCHAVVCLVRKMLVTAQRGTTAPSVPTMLSIATDCAEAMISASAPTTEIESIIVDVIASLSPNSPVTLDDVFVVVVSAVFRRLHSLCNDEQRLQVLPAWDAFSRAIFFANPPFPAQVVTAAAHVSAGLFMELGLGEQLCIDAVASLSVGGDGVELLLSNATEILTPVAALIALQHQNSSSSQCPRSEGFTTRVIDACFSFLARSQADTSVTPVVTRRLLIPLVARLQSNTTFIERMHALLRTLYDQKLLAELTVLTAALFDFLFSSTVAGTAKDYRKSPLLWNGLRDALSAALETNDDAAGKKTTMQLQVTYLLKRIVAMTVAHPPPAGHDRFHDFFFWTNAGQTESLWTQYFLVLETLNEYGVHINAPALAKLDDLFAAAAAGEDTKARFSPVWLELLMTKAVLHPNLGVRKLILRKLWTFPTSWVQLLSQRFLAEIVFPAASDGRLATDIDRVLLPGTFLECKVFDGREDHTLPKVLPLAEQMQQFYSRYFNEVCIDDNSRLRALVTILKTVDIKTARFTVSICVRVLWFVVKNLTLPAASKEPTSSKCSLLSQELVHVLQSFIRDQIHDRHQFWLEVRLNAIMLDLLLNLGAYVSTVLDTPITAIDDIAPSFRKLVALCSVSGVTGGKSVVTIDSTDSIGSVGSALPPNVAASYITRFSPLPLLAKHSSTMTKELVRVDTAVGDYEAALTNSALASPSTSDESEHFDETIVKEILAYISSHSDDVFFSLWRRIISELASSSSRSYISARQYCTLCQSLTEVAKSESYSSRLMSSTDVDSLSQAFSGIVAYAQRSIDRAEQVLSSVVSPNDFSGIESPWEALRTTHWDAATSAMSTTISLILRIQPSLGRQDIVNTLKLDEVIQQFVTILVKLSQRPKESSLAGIGHCGNIILSRSAARALQAITSGFASAGLESITNTLATLVPLDQRLHILQTLLAHKCFRLHLNASDTPTSLSGLSWGTITAQYFRALYNTIYALLLSSSNLLAEELYETAEARSTQLPALIQLINEGLDFGTDQMDACSTSNLSSLFDIVSWCVMAVGKVSVFVRESAEVLPEPERLISNLLNRLDDTQRREYFRCSCLAVYSLAFCEDHTFVIDTVMTLLNDETESERIVFFAASMICTKVLSNIEQWWPIYRDVILHIAVIYNSGRDEDELEGCLAVTEPAFATMCAMSEGTEEDLRTRFPPSVRLSALARALAISVILKACQMSSQRALETSTDLLKWNWANKVVSHEPCMPNSKGHRSRIRLWQLLCGLLPTLDPREDWRAFIGLIMKKAIPINNMGSVRRFMELYLIGALQRNPQLYQLLAKNLDDYTLRPQICGSYAMVAVHLLFVNETATSGAPTTTRSKLQDEVFGSLFPRMVRLCGSNQHLLRIISHIGVYRIVEMKKLHDKSWVPTPEVEAICHYIGTAPENQKFRVKHEEMVLFNPSASLDSRQLFCMQRKEAHMWLKESIPALSFDRVRFLQAELMSILGAVTPMEFLRCEMIRTFCLDSYAWKSTLGPCNTANSSAVSVAELGPGAFTLVPHVTGPSDLYIDYTTEAMETITIDDVQLELENTSASDNLQRKVTSWWNSEVYNELHPRALGGNERQSLVVVGTLLENPVNIAGLCRCGEIFAVEKVIVPDKKVFEHPHFVATARSAELWMPWEEVHPMNLIAYLERMRLEGYVILGVEQTANSVSMASYAFPDRVVMVLGSEGQGIPAEYLPYLDVCVEIPQYGLIRSLNVHVTGAVVMYEFTKQKLMLKNEAGAQLAKPSAFQ